MNEISSTGGTIIRTRTGLIHKGNTDRFDFETEAKRAVGRPTKLSVEQGLKFDFSAFASPIKLTAPAGRVISFK